MYSQTLKKKQYFFVIGIAFCLVTVLSIDSFAVRAQERTWSTPFLLYASEYTVSNPVVVTDAYGTVHVFWIETDEKGQVIPAIFHTQKNEAGWAEPNSVLLSPDQRNPTGFEVAADRKGRLHAIWRGSGDVLFYSVVDANQAHGPREWSAPLPLTYSLPHAGINTDLQGRIHIVYPGTGTSGVYYLVSDNEGLNWSSTRQIANPSQPNAAANYTQIASGPDGRLHVVWSEYQYPASWPPLGVYYSTSNDNGITWSTPVQLAGNNYNQAWVTTDQNGNPSVVWNGIIGVGGRYYNSSSDDGQNWGDPIALVSPKLGGTSGYPQLVFDSNGNGHFVTTTDWQGGIQYALKNPNESWTPSVNISGEIDLAVYDVVSIELPRLSISQGNRLHVVYEIGFKEIYYLSKDTGSPAIPAALSQPLFIPSSKNNQTILPSPTTIPTYQPFTGNIENSPGNPATSIIVGILPVIVVIILVILSTKRKP